MKGSENQGAHSAKGHSAVARALGDCWRAAFGVVAFSAVVNLLMLAGPLYMLQIYDRVLASRSVPTLVALSVFIVGAYGFQGALDLIRARILTRAAALLDQHLASVVHESLVRIGVSGRRPEEALSPMRDLDQIRAFLTGAGPLAIIDLPWMPLFIVICFLIHPWLGTLSLVGALTLLMLTFLTERATRLPAQDLARDAASRASLGEAARRNAESVLAMGMQEALARRWEEVNRRFLGALWRSSNVVSSYGSLTKMLRLLMQSAILGLGAYLVIRQELTPGGMIAASIMMGRALSPIETLIANWRGFVAARQSARRLSETLSRLPADQAVTKLSKPSRSLVAEHLVVGAPGTTSAIVGNVNFRLEAGEALGVMGASGSGKSSLVRVLVGAWTPFRGVVRLDGAALDQWTNERLGRHIGYVAQRVELFDGTIAENIARMEGAPDSDAVIAAAQAAGAHEMILRQLGGYDARIGETGGVLSGGQAQRIALARALYGEPFLVVLDEPSANLDAEGGAALQQAIRGIKERGAAVVLIAHHPQALVECEKLLVVAGGMQQGFGPRDEILRRLHQAHAATNLKVVGDTPPGGEA